MVGGICCILSTPVDCTIPEKQSAFLYEGHRLSPQLPRCTMVVLLCIEWAQARRSCQTLPLTCNRGITCKLTCSVIVAEPPRSRAQPAEYCLGCSVSIISYRYDAAHLLSSLLTSPTECTAGIMDPLLAVDSQHGTALAVLGPLLQHWAQLPALLLHGAVQRLALPAEDEPPLQAGGPTTAEACQLLVSWAELLLQPGQVRICHHTRWLTGDQRPASCSAWLAGPSCRCSQGRQAYAYACCASGKVEKPLYSAGGAGPELSWPRLLLQQGQV